MEKFNFEDHVQNAANTAYQGLFEIGLWDLKLNESHVGMTIGDIVEGQLRFLHSQNVTAVPSRLN